MGAAGLRSITKTARKANSEKKPGKKTPKNQAALEFQTPSSLASSSSAPLAPVLSSSSFFLPSDSQTSSSYFPFFAFSSSWSFAPSTSIAARNEVPPSFSLYQSVMWAASPLRQMNWFQTATPQNSSVDQVASENASSTNNRIPRNQMTQRPLRNGGKRKRRSSNVPKPDNVIPEECLTLLDEPQVSLGSTTDTIFSSDEVPVHAKKRRRLLFPSTSSVTWLPLTAGSAVAAYFYYALQFESKREETEQYGLVPSWRAPLMRSLPLRGISRFWGSIHSVDLPVWAREPMYRAYAYVFGCKLHEMANPDLKSYANLSAFFNRALKEGLRPIEDATFVSPADGRLTRVGKVEDGMIEQVKGVNYSLNAFLGLSASPSTLEHPRTFSASLTGHNHLPNIGSESTVPMIEVKEGYELFYCVIYLAPGDYHRFHSPVDWTITHRRHIAGELMSVAPIILKRMKNVFVLNERVVLSGEWEHGFFSLAPVGATNVGSIKLNFDEELRTNRRGFKKGQTSDRSYHGHRHHHYYHRSQTENRTSHISRPSEGSDADLPSSGIHVTKGQELGGFHLGSTVVAIFEAPKSFCFVQEAGQVVQLGQGLGFLSSQT